jgi:hypothetical protein
MSIHTPYKYKVRNLKDPKMFPTSAAIPSITKKNRVQKLSLSPMAKEITAQMIPLPACRKQIKG